jgi:hypothetical protein
MSITTKLGKPRGSLNDDGVALTAIQGLNANSKPSAPPRTRKSHSSARS